MTNARTVARVHTHTHTHTSKFIEITEGNEAFVCDMEKYNSINKEQTRTELKFS